MRYFKPLLIAYLLAATTGFISLAILVKSVPYFPLDLAISKSFQTINFPWFAQTMIFLSNSGWGTPLKIFIGLAVLMGFLLGKKLGALFIILVSLLDTALFFGLSNLVNRPRPSPDQIRVDFKISVGGFPSGHVLMYTLILGFLLYLTFVQVKNPALKLILKVLFLSLIILIGVARIYSGQHWPSDILGAYLLGSIGLIVAIYFYRILAGLKGSAFPKQGHQPRENP